MGQLGARRRRGGSPKRSVRFAWDACGSLWLWPSRDGLLDEHSAGTAFLLVSYSVPLASRGKTKSAASVVSCGP